MHQRRYEDLEPGISWSRMEDADMLLVYLPGFKKEQLKIQLTRSRTLTISGERLLRDNYWQRFMKEVNVPSSRYDTNGITAKFEKGVLYVTMILVPSHYKEMLIPPKKENKEKLLVHLPGFKEKQLRVELTQSGDLKICCKDITCNFEEFGRPTLRLAIQGFGNLQLTTT